MIVSSPVCDNGPFSRPSGVVSSIVREDVHWSRFLGGRLWGLCAETSPPDSGSGKEVAGSTRGLDDLQVIEAARAQGFGDHRRITDHDQGQVVQIDQ